MRDFVLFRQQRQQVFNDIYRPHQNQRATLRGALDPPLPRPVPNAQGFRGSTQYWQPGFQRRFRDKRSASGRRWSRRNKRPLFLCTVAKSETSKRGELKMRVVFLCLRVRFTRVSSTSIDKLFHMTPPCVVYLERYLRPSRGVSCYRCL